MGGSDFSMSFLISIRSMYGLSTYIWLVLMVNVGKHTWMLWVYCIFMYHLLSNGVLYLVGG